MIQKHQIQKNPKMSQTADVADVASVVDVADAESQQNLTQTSVNDSIDRLMPQESADAIHASNEDDGDDDDDDTTNSDEDDFVENLEGLEKTANNWALLFKQVRKSQVPGIKTIRKSHARGHVLLELKKLIKAFGLSPRDEKSFAATLDILAGDLN